MALLAPYLSHRLRKLDRLLSARALLGGAALGTAGHGFLWPGLAAVGASTAWGEALPLQGPHSALSLSGDSSALRVEAWLELPGGGGSQSLLLASAVPVSLAHMALSSAWAFSGPCTQCPALSRAHGCYPWGSPSE